MNYCLWCDEELIVHTNWGNVIHLQKQQKLCPLCIAKFKKITGNRCTICSRPSGNKTCEDCEKWKSIYAGNDPLDRNVSLYSYNHFMKEMIAKWKYRGDYILGEVFRREWLIHFMKSYSTLKKQAAIIPIPLSDKRLIERGFNQSQLLASFLNLKQMEILKRIHSEKQSKKTRIERMMSENPFTLTKPITKPVILIDDIYTTGRTIRHAANLLKINGCPKVYAYTLVRG